MPGPALPEPQESPKKHPGERLATYFSNFFATIVGISTLGASITFSSIISKPVEPSMTSSFSTATVQHYIAISWLLFALDLALTSFAASALSLYRPQAVTYFGPINSENRRIVLWYASFVSAVLFSLLVAAFVFLGLVVTAYAGPVGWAAVGFVVLFGALGLSVIVWQSPLGSERFGGALRQSSWKLHPSSEEMKGFSGAVLTGDEYVVKDGVVVRGHYVEDGLSRGASVARPLSGGVPNYTADLRRMRAASHKYDLERSDQRPPPGQSRFQHPDTRISYDEKDQMRESSDGNYGQERDPEIWIPAPRPRYDLKKHVRYSAGT